MRSRSDNFENTSTFRPASSYDKKDACFSLGVWASKPLANSRTLGHVIFHFYSCAPWERIAACGTGSACCHGFVLFRWTFGLFTVVARCDVFFFCSPCVFFSARRASKQRVWELCPKWGLVAKRPGGQGAKVGSILNPIYFCSLCQYHLQPK